MCKNNFTFQIEMFSRKSNPCSCLTNCFALLWEYSSLPKLIPSAPYLSSHIIYSIWVMCNQGMGLQRARPQITPSTRPSMWASPHSISTTWESRQWSRRLAKRPPMPFWQTIKSVSKVVKLKNIKTKNSSDGSDHSPFGVHL